MVNEEKMRQAAKLMLEAIGEDPEREGLVDTPERIARMYTELFSGIGMTAEQHLKKTFTVETGDMVLEKDGKIFNSYFHNFTPSF